VGSFFASTEQPGCSFAPTLAIWKVRVEAWIDSVAYLEALKGGGFRNAVQGERGQWVSWDCQRLLTVEPACITRTPSNE